MYIIDELQSSNYRLIYFVNKLKYEAIYAIGSINLYKVVFIYIGNEGHCNLVKWILDSYYSQLFLYPNTGLL